MRAKAVISQAASASEVNAVMGKPWKTWVGGISLLLFTLLLYSPSYRAGYIWDDRLLLDNPLVQGGWEGLRDIWTTKKFPDFCPVTATSFWIEAQWGGATPLVRHTTNIVLQGVNVVLLWMVLRRLRIPGAWLAAAIFAAHPLCVTSVTWMAERKNVLSLFFYLLSFLLYLSSSPPPGEEEGREQVPGDRGLNRILLVLSVLCYVAALLSKTSTVVLPVVFLLCAWWQRGRISRADCRRVLPFFGLALSAGLTTLTAHYLFGPKDSTTDGLLVRALAAAKAVWFYIGKAIFPANLTMHYGRWEIDPHSLASYLPMIALLAIFAVCWRFRRTWGRTCLFGLAYYLVALAPTLGIAKMTFLKFSQVADHFQFLALPGLIALVVGGCFHHVKGKSAVASQIVCAAVLLPVLGFASWKHQRIIGDAEAMWRDNLRKNPQSWLACNNVASILQSRGQWAEAETFYRQAIAMRPDYLDALSNLGVLLNGLGRGGEAIECYQKALSYNPYVAAIHFNLGTALYSQNQFAKAVEPLTRATELAPNNSQYHNNLASALMQLDRTGDDTLRHLQEAVRLNPANAEAQSNLGLLLSRQGKNRESKEQYERALLINPRNATAHYYLGLMFASEGQLERASEHLGAVTQLQPENASAHASLADLYLRQRNSPEAAAHRAMAAFLQGRDAANKNHLAEAKENFRKALQQDAGATIELAGKICTTNAANSLAMLEGLSSLCAETARTADTFNALQKVIDLAEAMGRANMVEKYRKLQERYQPGAPPPLLRRPQ